MGGNAWAGQFVNEMEQKIYEMHDARLNDHEVRFNQATRDFTEIKDWLKQLSERLNEGVAKTQQKILEKHTNLEISLNDLNHKMDLNNEKMNTKVDTVEYNLDKRIAPLELSYQRKDRFWWQILATIIIVMGTIVITRMAERLWPKQESHTDNVASLKAQGLK